MVTCPQCKGQLEDGAIFCDNCGAQIANVGTPSPPKGKGGLSCPKCGQPVMAGVAFCENCGASLSGAAVPAPARPPTAAPSAICPRCGSAIPVGAIFCDNCGGSVSAAPAQPIAPAERTPSSAQAANQAESRPPPAYTPRLVVQPTNISLAFPAGKTEVIAGREDPGSHTYPELNLAPYDPDKGGISRHHAKFSLRDNQWQIEDLNSTNFTFLNKQRVQPGQLCPLKNGDEIRLGQVTMRFFTN